MPTFGQSRQLVSVNLAHNALLGEFPVAWKSLQSLKSVSLSNNKFSAPSSGVSINLPNVAYLDLGFNSYDEAKLELLKLKTPAVGIISGNKFMWFAQNFPSLIHTIQNKNLGQIQANPFLSFLSFSQSLPRI